MNYSAEALKLTKEIKDTALTSGAELVGIIATESIDAVPRHWIGWEYQNYTKSTKDYMEDSQSVVILGFHVWDDVHEIVLARGDTVEYPIYQRMRLYTRKVLRFIQSLGYKTSLSYKFLSEKRMAQLAGLGSFGKNSLIINPTYGPWIRFQSILTDAILVPDEPFEKDLCAECEKCIKACPVGALTPYKIDPETCLIGITEAEAAKLIIENIGYDTLRNFPNIQAIAEAHTPRLTRNSRLMCMTCQKACPYGQEKRGHPPRGGNSITPKMNRSRCNSLP